MCVARRNSAGHSTGCGPTKGAHDANLGTRIVVFKVRIGIFRAGLRLWAPEILSDNQLPGALSMI
jgi:hypothetical protein